MPRKDDLEFRRGTAAQWTAANPVLDAGEPGWESDTNKLKIGDGTTAWASLSYFGGTPAPTGLGWVAGALTSVTPINNTVTPTTGGVTYAAPAIAAGQVYRIVAMGTFTRANSGTARNALISPTWGGTVLQTATLAVLINNAATPNWNYTSILTGVDTTHIWSTGFGSDEIRVLNTGRVFGGGAGSITSIAVPAGAQTLDLQFSMSVSVVGDSWGVNSIVIERLQ